jgi:hypothetical protein
MSAQHDPNSPVNEDITFEPTDVATKPIVLSVVLLAVFTLVFTAAGHLVYFGFAERERASSPEPSPLAAQHAAKEPPLPRLQIHPKTDLDVLYANEDKILFGWGWEDKEKGTARVPIERAMQMIVAKNLPARQGVVPWKMAPRGTAPSQPAEGAGAPDWRPGGASTNTGDLHKFGHGHETAGQAAAHGASSNAAHGKDHAPAHGDDDAHGKEDRHGGGHGKDDGHGH